MLMLFNLGSCIAWKMIALETALYECQRCGIYCFDFSFIQSIIAKFLFRSTYALCQIFCPSSFEYELVCGLAGASCQYNWSLLPSTVAPDLPFSTQSSLPTFSRSANSLKHLMMVDMGVKSSSVKLSKRPGGAMPVGTNAGQTALTQMLTALDTGPRERTSPTRPCLAIPYCGATGIG